MVGASGEISLDDAAEMEGGIMSLSVVGEDEC